jgi:hypothetical protein
MHYQPDICTTVGLTWNFGKLTHLTYLYYTVSILKSGMHYLYEGKTLPCIQYNTFLMANDCIDNLIQGNKLFPFGYHYKFTSEQIKNESIILVRNGQRNRGLLRICFPLGEL